MRSSCVRRLIHSARSGAKPPAISCSTVRRSISSREAPPLARARARTCSTAAAWSGAPLRGRARRQPAARVRRAPRAPPRARRRALRAPRVARPPPRTRPRAPRAARPTRRRQRREAASRATSPSVVSSSANGGDELGCSQNASASPAPRPARTSSKVFSMSVTYASATRLSTGLLSMSFTGNNDATKIRRRVRGFDLVKRLLAAAAGLVLLLIAAAYAARRRVVTAPRPAKRGCRGSTARSTVALDARAIATVRGESFTDVLRGQGYLHAQERFFQMDLLRRSSAGELAELFGERALAADRGQRPFALSRARAATPRGAAGRAERLARRLHARASMQGSPTWARARPSIGSPARAPRPWQPEDSLLVVLTFYTMLSNNDSYERAQGVMHAVLPPPLYDFLTPSTSRFDRPVLGSTPSDPTGGYVPLPIPGAGRRRSAAPARTRARRCAARRAAADGARVEQLGRRCNARQRRPRDRRQRPALEPAAAEHLLSHRARVAGPRSARREHSRACPAC